MNKNICQFYVIFGNRNFKTESNDNVYINATDIHDLKELSEKILNEYKTKAKQGVKVGSEIVFLIPNERYKTYTEDVIKKLKVNGKIELMQSPKIEPSKENLTKVKTPESISTPSVAPEQSSRKTEELKEKADVNQINTPQISTEKEQKAPVYKPSDNIYRGTINSSTYNNFQKPKKSNKVPIIIFIISLIFFIVSLMLLLFA